MQPKNWVNYHKAFPSSSGQLYLPKRSAHLLDSQQTYLIAPAKKRHTIFFFWVRKRRTINCFWCVTPYLCTDIFKINHFSKKKKKTNHNYTHMHIYDLESNWIQTFRFLHPIIHLSKKFKKLNGTHDTKFNFNSNSIQNLIEFRFFDFCT